MAAVLHGVGLVPPAPREDAGPRPAAPVVGHDVGPALGGVQRPVHAAPVADGEDVHLLGAMDGGGRPVLALVSHGRLGRHAADAFVAVAPRAHGGVDLVPGEAVRARRVAAASAGRQPTEVLGPWRGAVVEALEILQRGLLMIHPGDAGHVFVPAARAGVPLAAAGRPLHHLLAVRILREVEGATIPLRCHTHAEGAVGRVCTQGRQRPQHAGRHGNDRCFWGLEGGGLGPMFTNA